MPVNVSFGGVELTGDVQGQPIEAAGAGSGPVRIGLLGDFRGRGARGRSESGRTLAARSSHQVDRDNLDAVLARLGVDLILTLPSGGNTPISLRFRELDDFHPDRILARCDAFAALRQTRARLEDLATFAEAAAELGPHSHTPAPTPPAPPPPTDVPPASCST
jgi:type VI secretion system protein ImpC